jgi:hypothetical protein
MPKSTIHTINQKIYERHPQLEPNLIDFIIKTYFEEVNKKIRELTEIEITFLFGTFHISPKKATELTKYNNNVIKKKEQGNSSEKITEEVIQTLTQETEKINLLVERKLEQYKKKGSVITRNGKKRKRADKKLTIDKIENAIIKRKEDF